MAAPMVVYKGEIFREIAFFKSYVVVRGKKYAWAIPISEIECLNGQPCHDTECRHYSINLPDIDNCMLNIDREYTLDEIGQMMGGISRQRVEQLLGGQNGAKGRTQPGAVNRFAKRFKKYTGAKSIRDVLLDPPIPTRRAVGGLRPRLKRQK